MLYHCSLYQLDASQVLNVATSINHGYEKLNALQVLTFAIRINPGSGVGASTGVANSWSCDKLDVVKVLAVATNINHGAENLGVRVAKHLMLYTCSLWTPAQMPATT